MNESIVHQTSQGAALNAERYQTFEMAKANDGIIGGDNIAQIRSYAAYVRAQAQVIHKTIAATNSIDDVVSVKEEMIESEQTLAKVGIFCDQRIGEILRELPKAVNQHDASQVVGTPTSTRQAEKQAGIGHATSIDLQKMAANPEVVQAVLDKAEADGRIPSRKQVLDAINAKKRAEAKRDQARQEAQDAYLASENVELEVESLKEQLRHQPKPEVVEREVIPERTKQAIRTLESINKQQRDDYEKLLHRYNEARKELQELSKQAGSTASLDNALSELSLFRSKYDGISELTEIFEAIDRVMRG